MRRFWSWQSTPNRRVGLAPATVCAALLVLALGGSASAFRPISAWASISRGGGAGGPGHESRRSLPACWLGHRDDGSPDAALRQEDPRPRVAATRSFEPAASPDDGGPTTRRPALVPGRIGPPFGLSFRSFTSLQALLCVWLT